jgi:hypothetical protein
MGSHGIACWNPAGHYGAARTARRLSSLVGGRRARFCGPGQVAGALRISWPKSTVPRRADIQAEEREVRVGSNGEARDPRGNVRLSPGIRKSNGVVSKAA